MSTAETLTRWLLRTFADEWPGGLPQQGDPAGPLHLEDRDDARILDVNTANSPTTLTRTNRPSREFDLKRGPVLGVATVDDSSTPAGLGGSEYRREPILSVRIEAASTFEVQNRGVADAATFANELKDPAVSVVKGIDNGTLLSAPAGDAFNAEPAEQSPALSDNPEAFSWQFEVAVSAYQQ